MITCKVLKLNNFIKWNKLVRWHRVFVIISSVGLFFHINLQRFVWPDKPSSFSLSLNKVCILVWYSILLRGSEENECFFNIFLTGHGVGELGCAYADGCLTQEQVILTAYFRGMVSLKASTIKGAMADVSLGYTKVICLSLL